MNQPVQRRGLGRGLGSLIPTAPPAQQEPHADSGSTYGSAAMGAASGAGGVGDNGGLRAASAPAATPAVEQPVEVSGAYFAELPVGSIVPNARQPREVFDADAMSELVHSVGEIGLLQPIVVRRTGQDEAGEPTFELIMGERRWRATQEAGLHVIPAIVRQTGDDAMLRDALLENLHRSQLNPLEEAAAYRQLLDDFGCTHDELAGRIGRSRPQISNTLRLLNLSPAVQRRVGAGVLSAGHARALLGVSDPGAQDRLASKVVSEGISVRGLEEIVAVGDHGDTEGEDGVKVRPARPSAPGLAELNDRLSDRLDTRVKVTLGRSKGKISIEFASLTDLERIVAVIDPRNREDRPI